MSWKFYIIHIKVFFSKLEKKRRITRALISTASMLNTEYWTNSTFNDHFMWCLMCNICTQIDTVLFWYFFTRKNHIFFSHVNFWMTCSKPVQVKGPLIQDAVNLCLFLLYLLWFKYWVLTWPQINVFDIWCQLANVKKNMYSIRYADVLRQRTKKMHVKLSVKNDLFWNKCFIIQLKSNGVLSIEIVYKYRRIWHE